MSVDIYWHVLDTAAPPPQGKWWVGLPSEDPRAVVNRWVGQKGTLEVVDSLDLPYDEVEEWYGRGPRAVTPEQMEQIAGAAYMNGPTPHEVSVAAKQYPPGRYRWLILVNW